MAQRIQTYVVTVPPSTQQVDAVEVELPMAPGIVRAVRVIIPPGHAGLTGIALAQAHQVVIPVIGSAWIKGDNRDPRFELENYLDADTWSAFAYNTDAAYQHSFYLEFEVDELEAPIVAGRPPVVMPDIYAAAPAAPGQ